MTAVLHRWLVLLLLLLLAGSAHASCGDYLHVGAKDEPAKPTPAKPCDGPHCKRNQTPPIAPTPPPPPSVSDELVCVVDHADETSASRAGWLDLTDVRACDFTANSIFHPPR